MARRLEMIFAGSAVMKPRPPKISPRMAMTLHPVSRLHTQQKEDTLILSSFSLSLKMKTVN